MNASGEEGGGRVTLVVRGRGDKLVTKPKGKHAQQNSKNSGQNEANDQQRRNRPDNRHIGDAASHSPGPEPG